MDLRRISPALTREQKLAVVSVDQVMAQARIEDDSEIDLIADDIEAAYDYLSGEHGWLGYCCLLPEQFELYSPHVTSGLIEVPLRPLILDDMAFDVYADGDYSPVGSDLYYLASGGLFHSLTRPTSRLWPYVGVPYGRAYRIQFTAGYPTAADVPSPIKKAIRMLAAYWYGQRETVGNEGRAVGAEVEYGLRALCGRYRVANDHS